MKEDLLAVAVEMRMNTRHAIAAYAKRFRKYEDITEDDIDETFERMHEELQLTEEKRREEAEQGDREYD